MSIYIYFNKLIKLKCLRYRNCCLYVCSFLTAQKRLNRFQRELLGGLITYLGNIMNSWVKKCKSAKVRGRPICQTSFEIVLFIIICLHGIGNYLFSNGKIRKYVYSTRSRYVPKLYQHPIINPYITLGYKILL